jgi:hypothetical protein
VVRGRSAPGRRPPFTYVALAVVATGLALFALVVANVFLGQAGFAQAELRDRVVAKQARAELLELEAARLRAPSRIAARASELGLVPATDVTVLVPPPPVRGPSSKGRGR